MGGQVGSRHRRRRRHHRQRNSNAVGDDINGVGRRGNGNAYRLHSIAPLQNLVLRMELDGNQTVLRCYSGNGPVGHDDL